MKTIQINQQPVELYKILKFESLVDGGGEAKNAIIGGLVVLNSQIETQKRKKVYIDDIVEFGGEKYQIKLREPSITEVKMDNPQPTISPKKRSGINF